MKEDIKTIVEDGITAAMKAADEFVADYHSALVSMSINDRAEKIAEKIVLDDDFCRIAIRIGLMYANSIE